MAVTEALLGMGPRASPTHQLLGMTAMIGVVLVMAGCNSLPDRPLEAERVTFGGATYEAHSTESMDISATDLVAIGATSDANSERLFRRTVYALADVDPEAAVVMSAGSADSEPWVILVRDGTLSPSDRTLAPIAGICQYFEVPASQDCS